MSDLAFYGLIGLGAILLGAGCGGAIIYYVTSRLGQGPAERRPRHE